MAQGGTGQLRTRASILLPGYVEEVTHMEVPASHKVLAYHREGSRHGTEHRFVALRSSSVYIDKIS